MSGTFQNNQRMPNCPFIRSRDLQDAEEFCLGFILQSKEFLPIDSYRLDTATLQPYWKIE